MSKFQLGQIVKHDLEGFSVEKRLMREKTLMQA